MEKNSSNKNTNVNKLKNRLKTGAKYSLHLLSVAVMIGSGMGAANAVDPSEAAKEIVASEGGKEALNQALKMARQKPALTVAAGITCLACIPVAGASTSASLCVACGILIAKTLG